MLPSLSSLWSKNVKTKKQIYGLRRVRPGGPGDDEDDDMAEDEVDAKRTDETVELVCFNSLPYKVVDECIHCFGLSGMLDLTADVGDKALASVNSGILYTGLVMTDSHAYHLKHRILEMIYRGMMVEGNRFFQAKLAKINSEKMEADKKRKKDNAKDTSNKNKKKTRTTAKRRTTRRRASHPRVHRPIHPPSTADPLPGRYPSAARVASESSMRGSNEANAFAIAFASSSEHRKQQFWP